MTAHPGNCSRVARKPSLRAPALRITGLLALVVALSATGRTVEAADIRSVSRITFGPANTLFVADWVQSKVFALTLPDAAADAGKPFNLRDLDGPLQKASGSAELTLQDIAARPGSNEVYVAASMGTQRRPAIFAVKADGSVKALNLSHLPSTSAGLDKAPDASLTFWDAIPGRSFTVTDMKWHDGKLYLAGLSNQSFASTLRILSYPFGGDKAMASIEMYHTSHDQMETRAPIRAMAFVELDGKPTLLAAYLCTPLVTIPLDALTDGAHVKAKTIAELGDAGTPSDLTPYTAMDMSTGKPVPYVLANILFRASLMIPLSSVEEANRGPGYSKPVAFGQVEGVKQMGAIMNTVMRVDNQNGMFFVALRRDLTTGRAQLVSINKTATFRLSDYDISEYLFPDYKYAGNMQNNIVKPMQNMLKQAEGYPGQVRP